LFLLVYFPDCTLNVQRSIHMSVISEHGENTMQLDPMVARGRVVAAGRMLAGVDQDKLAAEAGLSPSTISKIELGRRSVREDTLTRVLDALSRFGVDVTRNSRTGHHAVGTSFF
jgi:ribosome-binding protein aMBF1 (putative translation factor)